MIVTLNKEQTKKRVCGQTWELWLCPFLKDWPIPIPTGHPKKTIIRKGDLCGEKMFEA